MRSFTTSGLLAAVPSSKAASTRLNMAKSFVVPQTNIASPGTSNMNVGNAGGTSYYKQSRPMLNGYNSEYSTVEATPMTSLSQDQLNQMNLQVPSVMGDKNMYCYN
ncbi:hypothetical protein HOLleu_25162 [Holothuria leucospilota]|uniref:Uncharacterized protein n=1 Tax=Holothuria leucospilota TaxID=206669 RepID=A0A9Q1BSN4_HOLLE|nr:hypothetical protein HOLleu_25162 [Holothuria leucospilota]